MIIIIIIIRLIQGNITLTPSGVEPATFQLEAQSLNKLRHYTF
jgi:hypothetical protein